MRQPALFHYYCTFSRHAGRKLHALVVIVAVAGLTESVGIGMFIPLLNQGMSAAGGDNLISRLVYQVIKLLHLPETFSIVLGFIVVVFTLKEAVALLAAVLSARIAADMTRDVRERFLGALVRTDYVYFLRLTTGFLSNIVTTETGRAVAAFQHYANTLVSIVYALFYATMCMFIDWRAALLAAALGIAIVASLRLLHERSRRYSLLTTERNGRLEELLIQTIHAFKYLRATDRFRELSRMLGREIALLASYVLKLGVTDGALRIAGEYVGILVVAVLLYVHVVSLGQPVSSVLVIVFLFYRLTTRLMQAQTNWQKFNATVGGLDRFADAFTDMEDHREASGSRPVRALERGIELRNVGFAYGDRRILEAVDMSIPRSTTVAIVGQTGAGKSTLVDLLTGVLRPTEGVMLVDGVDYREVDTASLRRLFGYVTQESVVFRDSVANNIAFWERDPGGDAVSGRIAAAARAAAAEGLIRGLDQGFDAVLGDRGNTLSGGQRQQICIARELYRDPAVLILDEATSALDARTAERVQQMLEGLRGRKTIVFITHRLASARWADHVYVLSEGRVAEAGTFDELMARADSRFVELYRLQAP